MIFTAESAEINYTVFTERKFFSICDCNYLVSCRYHCTKRTALLKFLKFQLDIDLKIILFNYQNNYIRNSSMINNTAKIFLYSSN